METNQGGSVTDGLAADGYRIRDIEHLKSLWTDIYSTGGRPCWDGMLPYYAEDIVFRDSIQLIRGKKKFTAMTRRLARRSQKLTFIIHNSCMQGDLVFVEWEMRMRYKKFPESSVYGSSRLRLRDGKVAEQRDYYDLWGDIFDNIPFIRHVYRRFLQWGFG